MESNLFHPVYAVKVWDRRTEEGRQRERQQLKIDSWGQGLHFIAQIKALCVWDVVEPGHQAFEREEKRVFEI